MSANQDYKELFSKLNGEKAEYLVIGAHAVIFYTEPRYTKDLDVWVNPSPENAVKVYRALRKFGAPLKDISVDDFTNPDLVYQIGIAPNRIDILMGIKGMDFADSWTERIESTYSGETIFIIGKQDLIQSKKVAGRPQDLLDIEKLLKIDHSCPK